MTVSFGFLLHADTDHGLHGALADALAERMGSVGAFLDEVILHALLDTLKLLPFLFITYLVLEFIEHRAEAQVARLMSKAGMLGPLVGGALGIVPQCGFSTVAANFYTGRVITLGTLIAVFLSTSDEMLPILIAGNVGVAPIMLILVYKVLVGIFVGFAVDLTLRLMGRRQGDTEIEDMCAGGCDCEHGLFRSSLRHTVSVGLYILMVTLAINMAVFFVGKETLGEIIVDIPVVSHLIASLVGLIPNCSASVLLTNLALEGFIGAGTMLSGLLTGAGVGVLVLLRMNRHPRENAVIIGLLVASGVLFGLLADLLPFITLV